jgi:hypothetical protein
MTTQNRPRVIAVSLIKGDNPGTSICVPEKAGCKDRRTWMEFKRALRGDRGRCAEARRRYRAPKNKRAPVHQWHRGALCLRFSEECLVHTSNVMGSPHAWPLRFRPRGYVLNVGYRRRNDGSQLCFTFACTVTSPLSAVKASYPVASCSSPSVGQRTCVRGHFSERQEPPRDVVSRS